MTINPASIGAICHQVGAQNQNDPFFSSVVALLHFDGTNGSTTVTNSCPRGSTWTCNAGVSLTTTSPQFGTACLSTGTGNSGLTSSSSDYVIGTGDFTAEWSFKWAAVADTYAIDFGEAVVRLRFDPKHTGGTQTGPYLEVAGASFLPSTGLTIGNLTTNVWHQFAISRASGTMYFYQDGVLLGSAASSHNFAGSAITIGKSLSGGFPVNANFDEFRLTIGHGRYIASNYSVAVAAFPNQ